MNIFDDKYKVSYFRTLSDTTAGVVVPLRAFLKETISPSQAHYEAIEAARSIAATDPTRYKEMKRMLPNATISAVVKGKRTDGNATPNGLICVDIDGKENPTIKDWEAFKAAVGRMPQVAFCGLSLSGNGVYIVEPLAYPQSFKAQFEQLRRDFAKASVVVDKACSNVSRTRVLSYDPHPYLNLNAVAYLGLYKAPHRPARFRIGDYAANDTEAKVAELCGIIQRTSINLTCTYADWVRVGMALTDLGERGRRYFHIVSAQDSRYNEAQCDRKYTDLMQHTHAVHVGTFFRACTDAGVVLPQHTAEQREAAQPAIVPEPAQSLEPAPLTESEEFERAMQEPWDGVLPF